MKDYKIEVGEETGMGLVTHGVGTIIEEVIIPVKGCAVTGYLVKLDLGKVMVIEPKNIIKIFL